MGNRSRKLARMVCQSHREHWYEAALDRLIAGQESPEFVRYRFQKLKRIKEGK